jgi:hypothetical protein
MLQFRDSPSPMNPFDEFVAPVSYGTGPEKVAAPRPRRESSVETLPVLR